MTVPGTCTADRASIASTRAVLSPSRAKASGVRTISTSPGSAGGLAALAGGAGNGFAGDDPEAPPAFGAPAELALGLAGGVPPTDANPGIGTPWRRAITTPAAPTPSNPTAAMTPRSTRRAVDRRRGGSSSSGSRSTRGSWSGVIESSLMASPALPGQRDRPLDLDGGVIHLLETLRVACLDVDQPALLGDDLQERDPPELVGLAHASGGSAGRPPAPRACTARALAVPRRTG